MRLISIGGGEPEYNTPSNIIDAMKQAMDEYKVRFDLVLDTSAKIGFDVKKDFEMAVRVTKEFYDKNKKFVEYLVKKFGKPILVEMWDERKFYFVLKIGNV